MNKQNIALNIEGLTKVYKNGVEAVKGVDLQVHEGDFFALLGPNGAGKSTTIGVISFATIEVTLGITVALSVMVLLKLTNASPNEVQSI